jgi:hypothetical protein
VPTTATTRRTPREAWTGIAFPVLFAAGVLVSSPPADDASNAKWLTNYTGHSEQARHLATGLLLVLAGLSLAAFLTALWRRIRVGRPDTSAFPLVAAAVSGACISAGGVVMGYVSGGELIGKYPLPSADLLRLSNDLGFALVGVAGMLATAAAVAVLSAQGRAAGLFGRKTYVLGIVTSVALLAALAFIPIIVLLLWSLVVAVQWLRG